LTVDEENPLDGGDGRQHCDEGKRPDQEPYRAEWLRTWRDETVDGVWWRQHACGEQTDDEDSRADLPRSQSHRCHAVARAEAQAFRFRACVADEERGGHRDHGRDAAGRRKREQAGAYPYVDDRFAGAVHGAIEERTEAAGPVRRSGESSVEQVEDGAEGDQQAGDEPRLEYGEEGGHNGYPEADQRQGVGRQAQAAEHACDRLLDGRAHTRPEGI
jgi:hypothetical protein